MTKALVKQAGSFVGAKEPWGYGGSGAAKNAASAALIDLAALGVPQALWLPGTAGNFVSTPDRNEIDYDSSTFENGSGRWEGLNKNLLSANQSSFETNVLGWESINSTEARTTAAFYTGTASMQLTCDAAPHAWVRTDPYGTSGSRINVVPGQVYTLIAYVKAATTPRLAHVRLTLSSSAANEAFVYVSDIATAGIGVHSGGWTQLSLVWQAPANVKSVSPGIFIASPAAGEVHYIDGVGLFETPNGNLISNSDFENGTTSWAMYSGTVTSDSTVSYAGRGSLKATNTTTGGDNVYVTIPVISGQTYTVSAYFRAGATIGRQFRVYTGQSSATAVTVNVTAANTWQRVTHTFTATSTASVGFYFAMTGAVEAWHLDAVQAVVGLTALEYLPPTTHNLVTNPSMETTLTPWQPARSIITQDTTRAFIGSASVKLECNVAGAAYIINASGTDYQAMGERTASSATITLSAYIYTSIAETDGFLQLLFQTASGGSITGGLVFVGSQSLSAGTWTRISMSVPRPPETGRIQLYAGRSAADVGDVFWVDAVQLEMGSVATPYVDGSLGPGYGWDTSDNMISNPSFEVDTAGWEGLNKNLLTANQSSVETDLVGIQSLTNATLARDVTVAYSGTASLSMTAVAAGSAGAFWRIGGTSIPLGANPVVPGQVYTATAYLRAAAASRQWHFRMYWYDAAGAGVSEMDSPRLTDHSAGWSQGSFAVQAPATAAFATVAIIVIGCAASEVHYVDAVGLFETPNGNHVANPDFESGTVGWTATNSSVASTSAQAYTGRSSAQVTCTTAANFYIQANTPGVADTTYTASAYVKAGAGTAGKSVSAILMYFNGNTYLSQTGGTAVALGAAWTRIAVTGTAPANATRADVLIHTASGAVNDVFYVDAVQRVVGSSAVEYLPPTTHNLVPNPSMEVDISTYGGSNATLARDTSWKYVGAASLSITATGTTVDNFASVVGDNNLTHHMGMVPGQTYTVSGYLKVPSTYTKTGELNRARGICIHVRKPGALGYYEYNSNKIEPGSEGHVSVTFTIAADAVGTFVRLYNGSATAGDVVYWDAIQLEMGSVATPYVDGSLGAGYAWDASENLHLSTVAEGTAGWFALMNAGTVTIGDTAQSRSGGSSVSWLSGAAGDSAIYSVYPGTTDDNTTLGPVPGEMYTHSAWVFSPVATQAYMRVQYDFVTSGGRQDGPKVDVPANTWTRVVHTTVCPPWDGTNGNGPETRTEPSVVATAASQKFYADTMQVEQRSYATPYAQASTAHASTSTRRQPWALGGTSLENLAHRVSATEAAAGSAHLDIRNNSIPLGIGLKFGAQTTVAVVPNTTYTLSLYSQGPGTLDVVDGLAVLASKTAGSASLKTNRDVLTFTTGASTTSVRVRRVHTGTGFPFFGALMYLDAVQLEQRTYATPFAQAGTAHASTSTRQQPWVLGGAWQEQLFISSNVKVDGTRSLLARTTFLPLTSRQHSGFQPAGIGMTLTVTANSTYTLSTWVYPEAHVRLRVVRSDGVMFETGILTGISLRREALSFSTGPATSISIRVVRATSSINDAFYLDAVQLEKASSASPYTPSLRITGDLDLRAHVALEDWTPGAQVALIARDPETAGNRGVSLRLETNGTLSLVWYADGSTFSGAASTIATGLADGAVKHVRATLKTASPYELRFYLSDDGVTWTQLGGTITGSAATSIFPAATPLVVGGYPNNTRLAKGKVLSASVRAGIDGPAVAEVDFTQQAHSEAVLATVPDGYWRMNEGSGTTLVDSSGNGRNGTYPAGVVHQGEGATVESSSRSVRSANTILTADMPQNGQTASIAFWIKFDQLQDTIANYEGFFSFRSAATGWTIQRELTGNILYIRVDTSAQINATGGRILALDGQWHHVVYTLDNGTVRSYIDGIVGPAFTYAVGGGFGTGDARGLTIQGDEARGEVSMYSRALTAAEVVDLYRRGAHGGFTSTTNSSQAGLYRLPWTVSRSGDATAEVVDRSTFAFTGTEYLTLLDRDVLDMNPRQPFTLAAGFRSRNGATYRSLAGKREGVTGAGYEMSVYSGQGVRSILNTAGGTASASQGPNPDGSPMVGALSFDGSTLTSYNNGVASTAITVPAGNVANTTTPFQIGARYGTADAAWAGLASWVALFRRILTATEHAALVAWNGSIATEPAWLRAAATVYINAADPDQGTAYRLRNEVLGLASQAQIKVKVGGVFVGKGTQLKNNGVWLPVA